MPTIPAVFSCHGLPLHLLTMCLAVSRLPASLLPLPRNNRQVESLLRDIAEEENEQGSAGDISITDL